MEGIVTLTLPKGAPADFVRELQAAVSDMDGVEDIGELGTRGLEVLTIGIWVKLASEPSGLTDRLIEVARELFRIVRGKGVVCATVTIGTTVIELGHMSLNDFEMTMTRLNAESG